MAIKFTKTSRQGPKGQLNSLTLKAAGDSQGYESRRFLHKFSEALEHPFSEITITSRGVVKVKKVYE